MKKILLLLVVSSLCLTVISQENPCPTVSAIRRTNIVFNGNGTCSGTVTLHIKNDVSNSNPKGVQVEVLCGSTTPVLTQCFIASTDPGGADYTTDPYTCPCNEPITIRITRFTASNGNCQGGTCGAVLIFQESPLPVDFKSFTAIRNKANVQLNWVTSTEKNSSGFAIERNVDGANWEEVSFVSTRAVGGNSNDDLTYQYSDLNITKGISQYRIRQVDIDNRSKFSEVRSVKGDGQIGKVIVYPNPTANGKLNVVFEDAAMIRNVSVIDMSGRTIRTINGIINNNITIDNLRPGIYSLRILVPATGEQVVEKIVVNQR